MALLKREIASISTLLLLPFSLFRTPLISYPPPPPFPPPPPSRRWRGPARGASAGSPRTRGPTTRSVLTDTNGKNIELGFCAAHHSMKEGRD